MLRKITCAAAGFALACAAAYTLAPLAGPSDATSLDLRWLYSPAKQDRLPVTRAPAADRATIAVEVPSRSTTIAAKSQAAPILESAVRTPRVRTIRIEPVREVPNNQAPKKERLPEGCEPAFSPVTMPAFAHISARCDS
jgi:hypothetical protein